jgi:asparagine synthase (glutamine-hydrolysing)
MLYTDLKTYLTDNILVKVDRMSMANSIEVRVPFLSHSFVEFVMKIPGEMKIKGFQTKCVLKKALADKLPPSVVHRSKQGFSIPMRNWLRSELRPLLLDTLSPSRIERVGLFRGTCVDRWVEEHSAGIDDHSHRLWALMLFHLWHDLYAG